VFCAVRTALCEPGRCLPSRFWLVSRWFNACCTISPAGFSYAVGASYAGESVEVVAGGLADILDAGAVVATRAQRFRQDEADRAPQARVAWRARVPLPG
jgi:hypothetical protein